MTADPFTISINTAFRRRRIPAAPTGGQARINAEIFRCRALHAKGQAHALEVWEVMYWCGVGLRRHTGAARVLAKHVLADAIMHQRSRWRCLVDRLPEAGFTLFDTQFLTAGLWRLSLVRRKYPRRLSTPG